MIERLSPTLFVLACIGCTCNEPQTDPAAPTPSSRAEAPTPPAEPHPNRARPGDATRARVLGTLERTAYGCQLVVEDRGVRLLTSEGQYHFGPDRAPRFEKMNLGQTFTVSQNEVLSWNEGRLELLGLQNGQKTILGKLDERPYLLLSSEDAYAWIARDGSRFLVQTHRSGRVETLLRTDHHISTATMLQDWVFWVERGAPGTWRMGGIPMGGGEPTYSAPHQSRTPALVVAADALYFYEGPKRGVRRMEPDLMRETVVHENVICSPFAVAERVVCAQVGGVFELRGPGMPPRVLAVESKGPITSIAVGRKRAAWVTDAGKNRLSVQWAPLAPPEGEP